MKLLKFILFLLIIFIIHSCNPCDNLDCNTSNYSGQFRIVSATDGSDLVFGSGSVYDKDFIQFYSLNGGDTTFLDYKTIRFPSAGYDSILLVEFLPATDIAYMKLGNGDIDTIQIFYNSFGTKCCGTITEITNFRFNNTINIPGSKGTQEIKK